MTPLVRSSQPQDSDLDGLRSRAAELEAALAAHHAETARVTSALDAFRVRYRSEVGLLHEQLDDLEQAIADAELGEFAKQRGKSARPTALPADARPEPLPRYTTDAVRRLFRDVAKTIHPDLAGDDVGRDRRHTLMVEANRAYALGDEERLRWVLQAWENSPEAVSGDDAEATRLRLVRRIAQIEAQMGACADDLAALKETPLWKLKAMVDEAAARGKDLVREMVGRLTRDIMVARNRLDAIRSKP